MPIGLRNSSRLGTDRFGLNDSEKLTFVDRHGGRPLSTQAVWKRRAVTIVSNGVAALSYHSKHRCSLVGRGDRMIRDHHR